jgi:hypothetical protein
MIQEESWPIVNDQMIDNKLRDFTVTATFVNPDSLADENWDFGICFHWTLGLDGQISQMEIVTVDSKGWCYYAPWPAGGARGEVQIETFEPTPGATTTIDLWVVERDAVVGVDGRCRVPLPLDLPPHASGVAPGTGFHPSTRHSGRKIRVKNFEVWELL